MTLTRYVRFAALGGLVLWAVGANAQSIDDARTAYREGRFLEAADLAEASSTSDGFALAAQSLAVYGHYVATEDDRQEILERAMELGEAAVLADSTNPEAYLQSVHAVGRYATNVGTLTALRRGLAGRIRDLLDLALALDHDFAEAHMALASWHADIHSAGRIARFMHGGNRVNAVIHYERALQLAPDAKVLLFEYGRRLPELDSARGRERAEEMLSRAAELPVRDAYEELVQEEILEALEDLETEGGG